MTNKRKYHISTIVPLYKGKKYIKNIIKNIERCAINADVLVQLILVNDYPLEDIEYNYNCEKDYVELNILTNKKNMGIHGTRIRGLEHAKGEMIHFLDQDDYVDDNFYLSQLAVIGNKDAVISLLYQGSKTYYKDHSVLDKYLSNEWFIKNGNAIISPGQVVIRKDSIPEKWKQDILKYNGADDYFLWLCMLHEGRKLIFNTNTFFHHVLVPGVNTSENWAEMQRSVQEVFWKCQKDYFDKREITLCFERQIIEINKQEKRNKIAKIIEQWMNIRNGTINIASYLLAHNYKEVSIYGLGKLGSYLYREIKNSVKVDYLFDQKVKVLDDTVVYNYKEKPVKNKIIILTIVGKESELEESLKKNNNHVIKLEKIISELYNTHDY